VGYVNGDGVDSKQSMGGIRVKESSMTAEKVETRRVKVGGEYSVKDRRENCVFKDN
jgi:hypothetical protein